MNVRRVPVPGFEGLYEIDQYGRVFSMGRDTVGGSRGGSCRKVYKPKQLTVTVKRLGSDGQVRLTDARGVGRNYTLSRLMRRAGLERRKRQRRAQLSSDRKRP